MEENDMTNEIEMLLNKLRSDDSYTDPFVEYEEETDDELLNEFYDDYESDYGYLDDEDYF